MWHGSAPLYEGPPPPPSRPVALPAPSPCPCSSGKGQSRLVESGTGAVKSASVVLGTRPTAVTSGVGEEGGPFVPGGCWGGHCSLEGLLGGIVQPVMRSSLGITTPGSRGGEDSSSQQTLFSPSFSRAHWVPLMCQKPSLVHRRNPERRERRRNIC